MTPVTFGNEIPGDKPEVVNIPGESCVESSFSTTMTVIDKLNAEVNVEDILILSDITRIQDLTFVQVRNLSQFMGMEAKILGYGGQNTGLCE